MTLRSSVLVPLSRGAADDFMQSNEILGNVGLGVWHFGLMLHGDLVGVVTFGTPCFSKNRGMLSGIASANGGGVIQLCRGGCTPAAPKNAASRLLSQAMGRMGQQRGNALVIAYSDVSLGEIGAVYQATNAMYLGTTDPKGQANYVVNGRKMSGWRVRKVFGTRDRVRLAQLVESLQVHPLRPKHRYAFAIGAPRFRKRLIRDLKPYAAPYPKRSVLGVPSILVQELILEKPNETTDVRNENLAG